MTYTNSDADPIIPLINPSAPVRVDADTGRVHWSPSAQHGVALFDEHQRTLTDKRKMKLRVVYDRNERDLKLSQLDVLQ